MDIAYSIDEKYVGYCLTSIASLLDNNQNDDVIIHILFDDLSDSAVSRISDFMAKRGGGRYSFIGLIKNK